MVVSVAPTCSLTSTEIIWPTSTVILRLVGTNPRTVGETEYFPGATSGNLYTPRAPVVVIWVHPFSMLFSVTTTLGTTAWEASVMRPVISPVVVDCPARPVLISKRARRSDVTTGKDPILIEVYPALSGTC